MKKNHPYKGVIQIGFWQLAFQVIEMPGWISLRDIAKKVGVKHHSRIQYILSGKVKTSQVMAEKIYKAVEELKVSFRQSPNKSPLPKE